MDLFQNPFHLLSATLRDNQQRIMELADEKSLSLDSSDCLRARSDLTNPRKRLSAEIAWLPGIGPKRVVEVLNLLKSSVVDLLDIDKLTPIARANLLSAGISRLPNYSPDNVANWILEIAWAFENINPEKLRGLINEERIVSGMPDVKDMSTVEVEIQDRRRYYRQVITLALKKLSPKERIEAVTIAVELATEHGEKHGPILVHDLVDHFEIEAQTFLNEKENKIKELEGELRAAIDAESTDSALKEIIERFVKAVEDWDFVAQPFQLSTKSLGSKHDASYRVAGLVRNLSIFLFNEHDMLSFSQQLNNLLQKVFEEVIEVAERTLEDANALEEIAERRKFSHLLDQISDICKSVIESCEQDPSSANKDAQKVIDAAPSLVANLTSQKATSEIVSQGKDELALTLMHCAVTYGNKTEKWKPCISILEKALEYSSSQEVTERIEKNLKIVQNNERLFGDLKKISSAPSLSTINGFGFKLYGSTDHDQETNSYLSTYYFVALFIPIFPICRYRVIQSRKGYSFLGKAPLRSFDKWHLSISLALIALFIFMGIINSESTNRIESSVNRSVPTTSRSYNNTSTRSSLEREIEQGKAQAVEMETQLEEMDSRLEEMERRMQSYEMLDMADEYNALVPSFNSVVGERNDLYEEYQNLIDEVNAKIKRYNSGYR